MQEAPKGTEVRCQLCDRSVEIGKSFACKRCRKSPFCLEHLDAEYKVCSGCAAEERVRLSHALVNQERSVKGFLRLTQFILSIAALFYAANKLAPAAVPPFLRESIFFDYVVYWGAAAAIAMILCFFVLLSYRQKVKDLEEKIQDHKGHSRFMFR